MRYIRTQSGSISPISSPSSKSSLTELKVVDSQPIPSTSTGIKIDSTRFTEVDLQSIPEKTRRTSSSSINSISLHEASITTNSDGNINPNRNGVYARVRNSLLRYGAAGVIGSAAGVVGFEVNKQLSPDNNNNNNTQINNITKYPVSVNSTNTTLDSDGIINPME